MGTLTPKPHGRHWPQGRSRALAVTLCTFLAGAAVGVFSTLLATGILSLPFSTPPVYSVASTHDGPTATVVVMHFKRTENVKRIVSVACAAPSVSEVIVWDANTATHGVIAAGLEEGCRGSGTAVRVVSVSDDFGLQSRYAAGLLASNDLVIIQDDDIEMSPVGYDLAVAAAAEDPTVIHGPYGRWPTQSEPYDSTVDVHSAAAPIILTKFLVAHRTHFAEFFKWAPVFERTPAFAKGVPHWNGEDLALSLSTLRANGGRLHHHYKELMKHLTPLAAPNSISGRMFSHHVFRSEFVQQVSGLLGLRWPKSTKNYPNPVEVYDPTAGLELAGDGAAVDTRRLLRLEAGAGVGADTDTVQA